MFHSFLRGLFIGVWVLPIATGHAEIPDNVWGSEMLPPTAAEWIRAYLREAERNVEGGSHGEGHHCQKVVRSVAPLSLNVEVEYLPCSPSETCRTNGHKVPLHSGEYGMFHPGAYYIPNPTVAVEFPTSCRPCQTRSVSAKISPDPNNRIEMTIGVWE
ncbi:hypothetical protein K2X85_18860 [bacterium]|jgi:hypothetical protein|nr:hypothetical protein [bacterium]